MLQVEIRDKYVFLAAFMKMPEMVSKEIRKEMKASLSDSVAEAGTNHEYISRSGSLDKDSNYDIEVSGSGFEGTITLNRNLPYSHIQHDGGTIAAEKIKPKKPGGLLKFNVGAEIVFARRIKRDIVIKATRFLTNAAEKMRGAFTDNMEMAIARGIRKAGF